MSQPLFTLAQLQAELARRQAQSNGPVTKRAVSTRVDKRKRPRPRKQPGPNGQ